MSAGNFPTLVQALRAVPTEKPFITMWKGEDNIETVTFGEFLSVASAHAAGFAARGLKAADRIILVMPQGIPLMAAFAGAMLLGAVPAILAYPNFKVEPRKYSSGLAGVAANLKASLVIVDRDFPEELLKTLEKSARAPLLRAPAAPCGGENFRAQPAVERDNLAFIQHSAGTTGLQKGVALTHGAVLTQLAHLAAALALDSDDRIYSWLPLYHDMGLIACFMLPLAYHLPVVMQSPLDWVLSPEMMVQLISEHRCTLAWIPNFAFQLLARRSRRGDGGGYDLSHLRALVNCSEPVRAPSIDEFQAAYAGLGLREDAVKTSYALAENVFAVTQSDIHRPPRRLWISAARFREEHAAVPVAGDAESSLCLVSSGRCLPGNRVRIVSAEGADLPEGRVGEILIQSDSLFSGYYNRPELTAKAFRDGWYRSGDLGFLLDGELYVIGRKNDLMIVAGKNVYPQDVEEIACNHPAIHDGRAVAFGLYNSSAGTEELIVVAEVQDESFLAAAPEIEKAVRNAIASELDVSARAVFLRPPKWIVKSTAGKPARAATREKLLIEQPELVEKEHEYLFELVGDSVMTRTLEGRINFWNRRAEELYGWTKEEAVGRVSHDLLRTKFPKPLAEIDSELIENGRWEGKLVHATRDGGQVVVESRWVLNLKRRGGVVEINRPAAA
ncbi:MAG TPA: AMP-binding protein [Candidatus Acidoferrales bacterium]|nr:AMP-binding protein [Candidatus Acidoferrales bacterium]